MSSKGIDSSQKLSEKSKTSTKGVTEFWAKPAVRLGAFGAAIWIAVIVASGLGWNPFGVSWDFSNSGAFGDSFGPLSALMASVAAIGAIAAYKAQSQEMARVKHREEAADLEASKEKRRLLALERKTEKRQRKAEFEQTFFSLLSTFRDVVRSIDIQGTKGDRVAHDAFNAMVSKMSYSYGNLGGDKAKLWESAAKQYANDLNHYFRLLYHLVRFVDTSEVEDKYFYVRLVRAHLSESELILLGMNCAHGDGREKFKLLVEKYALLHNLSQNSRDRWKLTEEYAATAFEREKNSASQ